MGFTGRGFVGFIGVSRSFPPDHVCAAQAVVGSATATATIGAPAGVREGGLMVACLGGGSYVGGSPWTLTPDPAWSLVYSSDYTVDNVYTNLYSKIADAADEAGTASYSWSLNVSGGLAGITVIHVGIPRRFATTVSDADADHSSTPSLSSPGGDWQLAFVYQRTANNFAQPSPDPVVTSDAVLMCSQVSGGTAGYRAGNMRVYASDNVSPITGDYLMSGIDNPRQGLIVAAMS